MDIHLTSSHRPKLRKNLNQVLVNFLPTKLKNKSVIFGLHFVDQVKIQQLNAKFRTKNQPTTVLSFPLQIEPQISAPLSKVDLGDIYICPVEADKKGFFLHYLIIHGFLHLIGLDHQTEKQNQIWEKFSFQILKSLKSEINQPRRLNQ